MADDNSTVVMSRAERRRFVRTQADGNGDSDIGYQFQWIIEKMISAASDCAPITESEEVSHVKQSATTGIHGKGWNAGLEEC